MINKICAFESKDEFNYADHLGEVLSNAKVCSWVVDFDSGKVFLSENWHSIRGLKPNDISNEEDWLRRIHPDDKEVVVQNLRRQNSGESHEISYQHRELHPNGHWEWYQSSGRTVFDQTGKALRFVGTNTIITELKNSTEAIQALSNNEKRFRIAVESAGHGLWDVDITKGGTVHTTDWYKMRGLDPDLNPIVTYEDWISRVHPDDVEFVKQEVAMEESSGADLVWRQYRERHEGGHYIWILCRGRVVSRDANGRATRVIGTDTDISELKAAELRLRQLTDSERRWKIAVESAGEGVWDINHHSGENYFSDGWRVMRGMAVDEPEPPKSSDWLELIHPEDKKRLLDEFAARDRGTSNDIHHEYRQLNKSGSYVWIMSRGKIVERDHNGKIVRMIGTDTDISNIKKNENEIRRLAHRLELAVDTSKVCIWEYDLQQKLPLWDANMCELFDVSDSENELVADIWESRLHSDDRARATKIAEDCVAAKGNYDMDYRIVCKNGTVRHIRCRATYFLDKVTGPKLIGASWDVTADHLAADELRSAKELAERRNEELVLAKNQMEHISYHDALTGLPNRRMLDEKLALLSNRPFAPVALLHIDVDRFKHINDTLGHQAGDHVLKAVAKELVASAPPGAIIARTGGDEFVMLIDPAPSSQKLTAIGQHLVNQMRMPIYYGAQKCRYSCSIGIAVSSKDEYAPSQLLINADLALYQAKSKGRNCFEYFSTELKSKLTEKKQCADEILAGLERGEFVPAYQLQFDANNMAIVGVEALVRWQHPERGLLPPLSFLDVAEEINVVARIDETILIQALRDFNLWRNSGIAIPKVSVNVSSRRLSDENLIQRLDSLKIEPGTVSFELLESIWLDNQEEVVSRNLAEIKKRGIAVEIDDFGTGHASIACLSALRPDCLKIDRQFIKSILVSVEQRRLVRSIIDIGKSLGIRVLAEGVENTHQIEVLRDLGCDYLQGYSLALPMSAEAILDLHFKNSLKHAS